MSTSFSAHTTLRVGGPADSWITVDDEAAALDCVRQCDAVGIPLLVVGGGSNLLVGDEGFRGTVLEIATRGVSAKDDGAGVVVALAAGEEWDAVVAHCVTQGWSGVEALAEIGRAHV